MAEEETPSEPPKRKWRRNDEYAQDPNRLLTIKEVVRIIRKADDYVSAAMDMWTQSQGRRGLRYVLMGHRRAVRYGSLNEWLTTEEEMTACR
jgi:hypothetical protein